MAYIKALGVSVLVALAIIFMIQNIEALNHPLAIRLNLFVVKLETTPYATYLVILLAFFLGLLSASLLGILERLQLKSQLRGKKKEIKKLTEELNNLRQLPITGDTVLDEKQIPQQIAENGGKEEAAASGEEPK